MKSQNLQKGLSLIELLIVMVLLAVLITLTMMSFSSSKKYSVDDQASTLTDFLDEARQNALNKRRTFRVEINKTLRQITLINENEFGVVTDDSIVRSVPFNSSVQIGGTPNNVSAAPTTTSPIPVLPAVASNYPLSNGNEKITLRFTRNGRVVDTGSDNIGTGSLMRGATIYVYSNSGTGNPQIIRAVTVLESSGDTSILKCTFDGTGKCGNWHK